MDLDLQDLKKTSGTNSLEEEYPFNFSWRGQNFFENLKWKEDFIVPK